MVTYECVVVCPGTEDPGGGKRRAYAELIDIGFGIKPRPWSRGDVPSREGSRAPTTAPILENVGSACSPQATPMTRRRRHRGVAVNHGKLRSDHLSQVQDYAQRLARAFTRTPNASMANPMQSKIRKHEQIVANSLLNPVRRSGRHSAPITQSNNPNNLSDLTSDNLDMSYRYKPW